MRKGLPGFCFLVLHLSKRVRPITEWQIWFPALLWAWCTHVPPGRLDTGSTRASRGRAWAVSFQAQLSWGFRVGSWPSWRVQREQAGREAVFGFGEAPAASIILCVTQAHPEPWRVSEFHIHVFFHCSAKYDTLHFSFCLCAAETWEQDENGCFVLIMPCRRLVPSVLLFSLGGVSPALPKCQWVWNTVNCYCFLSGCDCNRCLV